MFSQPFRIKPKFCIFAVILTAFMLLAHIQITKRDAEPDVITCYDHSIADNKRLPNVLTSESVLMEGRNIFFHETSCSSDGIVKLTHREACAIESTANLHPDWNVFVLFANDVGFRNLTPLPIIDKMLAYPNVVFRSVNITEYAQETPLEEWIKGRALFRSKFIEAHFSDILRLISLYKFGGIHLDMDVVVMKSLNSLKSNYAGCEDKDYIASGVMNFENYGFGHKFMESCLSEIAAHYDGTRWSQNGPVLITEMWKKMCGSYQTGKCPFTALPVSAFYAIGYNHLEYFFEPDYLDVAMKAINESVLTHVWNKLTYCFKVKVGSQVAYGVLADKFCPNIYRLSGEYF